MQTITFCERMWWDFQRDFLFYQIIWDIGSIEEARRGCFCSTFHILRPSHRKTSASGNEDLSLRGILPIPHLQTNIQFDRILCDRRASVLQLLNKGSHRVRKVQFLDALASLDLKLSVSQ